MAVFVCQRGWLNHLLKLLNFFKDLKSFFNPILNKQIVHKSQPHGPLNSNRLFTGSQEVLVNTQQQELSVCLFELHILDIFGGVRAHGRGGPNLASSHLLAQLENSGVNDGVVLEVVELVRENVVFSELQDGAVDGSENVAEDVSIPFVIVSHFYLIEQSFTILCLSGVL